MSKKKINKLKNKLKGGQLSQQQAEDIRQQILGMGGKVNLTNFGYNVSGQNAQNNNIPSTQDVAAQTTAAQPIKDPGSVYTADVAGEMAESAAQINFQNPNVYNPFGSSETTLNPDGTVTVNQSLSGDQQQILDADETLSQQGRGIAQNYLKSGLFSQPFQANTIDRSINATGEDRRRIEDAVYDNLTRRFDRDEGRLVEAKKQELENKGIPYSDDPESRYQREMGTITERFDDNRNTAALNAVQFGGNEMAQLFGMQEQQIANEFSQGAAERNQNIGELNTFANFGSGLQVPNFQPYQGPNYDVGDPSSYIYAGKELKMGNKAFNLEKDALAQQNAIANKQLAAAAGASQPQAPAPPPFP